jgi:hypothetical protein
LEIDKCMFHASKYLTTSTDQNLIPNYEFTQTKAH